MPSATRNTPVTALGDVGLVCAITRGNADALAEAYERNATSVLDIARRLIGPTRAQDIVQEIFLALWLRPERYDCDRGSLGAFLSMQTHGRSVDLLRSDRNRRARELGDGARRRSARADSVGTTVDAGLERDELDRALAALPVPEREAIILAYFGGHTYREVARILDEPEGTVKSRIRAGLARLRDRLVEDASNAGD